MHPIRAAGRHETSVRVGHLGHADGARLPGATFHALHHGVETEHVELTHDRDEHALSLFPADDNLAYVFVLQAHFVMQQRDAGRHRSYVEQAAYEDGCVLVNHNANACAADLTYAVALMDPDTLDSHHSWEAVRTCCFHCCCYIT